MTAPHDPFLDLCAAYAVGALDAEDRRRLQEHVRTGCPECTAALGDFAAASVEIAESAPRVAPPPAAKARVMAAIRAQRPGPTAAPAAPSVPARARPWPWIAAAAVLLVVAGAGWLAFLRTRGDLDAETSWSAVLRAPGAKSASLALLEGAPAGARARATYDPASRRAVVVFEHLRTPTGKDFELWSMHEDGVRSLGLVRPDASGRAEVRVEGMEPEDKLVGFAVSLEEAGGSPKKDAPQGPVQLAGKF